MQTGIVYLSSGPCINTGATYTMTSGTGRCQVILNQLGDDNYNAAPIVIRNVTAALAQQAGFSIANPPTTINYNDTVTLSTVGGSGTGAVSYTVNGGNTICSITGSDLTGSRPYGKLVQGTDGNLFGTTTQSGDHNLGTVFTLSPIDKKLTVLASFDLSTGGIASAGLMQAADGNLYGTTTSFA
ncbi:MAG: hypothetical protein H2069_05855 [Legionella sp.]|nr:hypothetical protein [Legionella sp.]